MKKKNLLMLIAATLSSSVLLSSCIGPFALTNKLLSWNKSVDNKFVNELIFFAFWIVPVYEVTIFFDAVLFNSIEFWGGNNPVADVGSVKNVETSNGTFLVETKENGYHIQKEGEKATMDLVYNNENKTWSVNANGESFDLMQFKDEENVVMFLPDGGKMDVELNAAGAMAFKQVAEGYSTYFAAR
ncbi:MAG: DUF3332 domain-containing protein [Parabacteroides sp.]|nr:DUF3332 domain-containing protein [Parabacteroides sp.]